MGGPRGGGCRGEFRYLDIEKFISPRKPPRSATADASFFCSVFEFFYTTSNHIHGIYASASTRYANTPRCTVHAAHQNSAASRTRTSTPHLAPHSVTSSHHNTHSVTQHTRVSTHIRSDDTRQHTRVRRRHTPTPHRTNLPPTGLDQASYAACNKRASDTAHGARSRHPTPPPSSSDRIRSAPSE